MGPNLTFGKFYAKTFTGSMHGAGPVVFAVWGYSIANARPPEGLVELNPSYLSHVIGTTGPEVESAIEKLCSPDPRSRTKKEDGRRLVKEGEFLYRLVTFLEHRGVRDEESRKEYERCRKAEYRSRITGTNDECPGQVPMSAQAEAEAEAEKTVRKGRFAPPSLDEVREYGKKIELPEGECCGFHDWFTSNGWKVGKAKTPMVDWEGAIRTWKRNWLERQETYRKPSVSPVERKRALEELISVHRCNRDSLAFRNGSQTKEDWDEYRKLKSDLSAVRRQIAGIQPADALPGRPSEKAAGGVQIPLKSV